MQFNLVNDWREGELILSKRIQDELKNKKVLWLVSGGSNIEVSVSTANSLPVELTKKLTIALVDERYGEVSHPYSNWHQLLKSGFKAGDAKLIPVLKSGLNLEGTVKLYDSQIENAFNANEIVIAQLGIGDDGHVAGILPKSPATKDIADNVVGYVSDPYKRITLTFSALRQIDTAYIFAFGENKKTALANLKNSTISKEIQPAQIIKELSESYIFNDQLGDKNV